MMRIADRYFDTTDRGQARIWPFPEFTGLERRIAVAMVAFLVLINQAQVGVTVRLSFFNRDLFNAIQAKDAAAFWELLLLVFLPWAFALVASYLVEFVVQSMLVIRWRRWLTEFFVARWLRGHTHYRMSLTGSQADNPDQRISEDVNRFIDGGKDGSNGESSGIYSYSILLISTLSSLVSFAVVLWGLSTNFTIPGTDLHVPGFLFWIALIYAAAGTWITHVIGRSLIGLYFERQHMEADFRFSLARLREYTEQVALLDGERAEEASLGRRFGGIIGNWLALINRRMKLLAFTQTYGQLSPIIPYIFTAPFFFADKITLGVMTQTAGAFGRVEGRSPFFITYYNSSRLNRPSNARPPSTGDRKRLDAGHEITDADGRGGGHRAGRAGDPTSPPDGTARRTETRAPACERPARRARGRENRHVPRHSGIWLYGGAASASEAPTSWWCRRSPTFRSARCAPPSPIRRRPHLWRRRIRGALVDVRTLPTSPVRIARKPGRSARPVASSSACAARALLTRPDWLFRQIDLRARRSLEASLGILARLPKTTSQP
jgi:putative ATP-binding cassette transporter